MEQLPAEVWEHIFGYLPLESLCAMTLVSQRYFALASTDSLWFALWNDLWDSTSSLEWRDQIKDWRKVYIQYNKLLKISQDITEVKEKLNGRLAIYVGNAIYALALVNRYTNLAIALFEHVPQDRCCFELIIHLGSKNVAKALLKNGFDPNTMIEDVPYISDYEEEGFGWGSLVWNFKSILHYAAFTGDPDTVKMILAKGALVDISARYQCPDSFETASGKTPLQTACYYGNLKVVKMLIEKGADVNSVSRRQMDPEKFGKPLFICDTPLICAVAGGHLDVVQALVGAGADISFKVDCGIDSGKNAMEIAALLGFSEIHNYLAKHIWWCSIM